MKMPATSRSHQWRVQVEVVQIDSSHDAKISRQPDHIRLGLMALKKTQQSITAGGHKMLLGLLYVLYICQMFQIK